MKMKHTLWASAASMALMLGACTTQRVEPFTQTSIEGSDIQSVPTPLDPVPEEKPVEVGAADEITVTGRRTRPEFEVAESAAPPPPPAISAPAPSGLTADIASGASRFSKTSPTPGLPGIAPGEPHPQPNPQSGLLTAGDYDDVLNPHLYTDYLAKTRDGDLAQKGLPYVDAADRIAIRITDRLGKPMPFADITLSTPQGAEMFLSLIHI